MCSLEFVAEIFVEQRGGQDVAQLLRSTTCSWTCGTCVMG
jgi:NAD(P)H-nitrite reductase large subunit